MNRNGTDDRDPTQPTPLSPSEPSHEELAFYEVLARRKLRIGKSIPEDPEVGEALLWSHDVRLALMRLIRTVQRHQGRIVPPGPYDQPPLTSGKFGRYWPYDLP